jgi:hypothetical protein
VLISTPSNNNPDQGLLSRLWGSGFLPSRHQGVKLRSGADPVLYLNNPDGVTPEGRRLLLDRLKELNEHTADRLGDTEIDTRISQYEMAYRMQTSVPAAMDLSKEPDSMFELYGPDRASSAIRGKRLLRGGSASVACDLCSSIIAVGISTAVEPKIAEAMQRRGPASAALVADLKQRGMLDETLIIWGGEFGRTVYAGLDRQRRLRRDHHPRCFTTLPAGGGVKGGIVFGETDDYSYNIVESPVHA